MIEQLENQVDNETMKNVKQKQKNEEIRSQVTEFGNYYEEVFKASANPGGMTAASQGDNSTKYRMIPGITDFEVNQLLELDQELKRKFEIQQRKKNKNDEMVRTKIRDLNEKPALRDFLFKKVSDEQLQKDILTIEAELDDYYKIL